MFQAVPMHIIKRIYTEMYLWEVLALVDKTTRKISTFYLKVPGSHPGDALREASLSLQTPGVHLSHACLLLMGSKPLIWVGVNFSLSPGECAYLSASKF